MTSCAIESFPAAREVKNALPIAVVQRIHSLALKVGMCSQSPGLERKVVLTLRRRPINGQGFAGCWASIWTNGPLPLDGLQALRDSQSRSLWQHQVLPRSSSAAGQETIASFTAKLEPTILGGWMVTVDARWHPQTAPVTRTAGVSSSNTPAQPGHREGSAHDGTFP